MPNVTPLRPGDPRRAVHPLGQEDVLLRRVLPGEVIHPAGEPVAADATGIAGPQGSDVGHPASSHMAGVCVVSGLYPTHSAGFNARHQGKFDERVNAAQRFPVLCGRSPAVLRPPGRNTAPLEPWVTCARSHHVTEFPAGIGHNCGAPSVTRKAQNDGGGVGPTWQRTMTAHGRPMMS